MKFKIFILACLLCLSSSTYAQFFNLGEEPPGYVKPTDYKNTCFDYMGAVDFTSAWRFKGDVVNGASTGANRDYTYGFSIPLVADLNKDKYPEIIVIRSTLSSLQGYYNGIKILNGQTGKELAKLSFDASDASWYGHVNAHGSPSIMALADVDNDGFVEAFFAFPGYYGNGAYLNKVAMYKIKPAGNTYTWQRIWVSAENYNKGETVANFEKPIPQIVDIDGDGNPELVVYNKIYNVKDGTLLVELETLSTAYIGNDVNAYDDRGIGFGYTYDMDFDGKYDVVAGGKIYYDINPQTGTYQTMTMPGVPDGRTGVADINGDGIPDVVSINRVTLNGSTVRIVVWNPNFYIVSGTTIIKNPSAPSPSILADYTFDLPRGGAGYNSYVYIGDIDGRIQTVNGKEYRLPEIAILGGRPSNTNFASILRHPNVGTGIPAALSTSASGGIFGFSWDASATVAAQRLKLSFVLEHQDRSQNTGFTMFDFDNDGVQEICYRDEQTLRIIKGEWPYIKYNETDKAVIKFTEPCFSFTGYEYPVIADIDNDASAEMVVIGRTSGGTDAPYGYAYAVGNGTGDKFAPALPVWNQFMYDPFKINKDLTVPSGPAKNRLLEKYTYTRLIADANNVVTKVIDNYLPYNGTLIQSAIFSLESKPPYDKVYDPIVFLTEAYIQDKDDPLTPAATYYEAPYIDVTGRKIVIHVGNRATAETDLSANTPITVYENSILPTQVLAGGVYSTRKAFTKTLSELGVLSAIKAGEEVKVEIPLPTGYAANGFYIVRLGDASTNITTDTPTWSFGINNITDTPIVGMDGVGLAQRAYRDCDWSDQTAKVSALGARDDTRTIMNLENIEIDVLANDYLPTTFFEPTTPPFSASNITSLPIDGTLSFTGTTITYKHNGLATLPDGIDKFTYKVTYIDPVSGNPVTTSATVYIFILKSDVGNFAACPGTPYNLTLRSLPTGVAYKWYADATTATEMTAPGTIPSVTADLIYYVEPRTATSALPYNGLVFPRGKLTVKVVTQPSPGVNKLFKWTGIKSSNWNDPANWLEVDRTTLVETAAPHAPSSCVDVIIPTVTTNYPVLLTNEVSQAGVVQLAERGLLQNSYKLVYNYATLNLGFKAGEIDRWVLYSSPFSYLFSGDFTTKDTSEKQNPRATYMSLYEAANPDNGAAAAAKTFTQPFGKVDLGLTLSGTFMIYIDSQYGPNARLMIDQPYSFTNLTHSALGATDRNKGTVASTRKPRFVYESASNYAPTTGVFSISYPATSTYILATNPFPAYLSLQDFLTANNAVLDQSYKVWNGTPSDTFVTRTTGAASTWKVSDTAVMDAATSTTYIAPFQSFFIKRKTGVSGAINVSYNPTMTRVFIETDGYKFK